MPADYHLLQPIQAQLARFRFDATFQNKPVHWQAELLTLEYYYQRGVESGLYAKEAVVSLQQFIEIAPQESDPRPIRIVLALPQITRASLLKTIIMIRNYKRLHTGRHSYGDYFEFRS